MQLLLVKLPDEVRDSRTKRVGENKSVLQRFSYGGRIFSPFFFFFSKNEAQTSKKCTGQC